MSIVAERTGSQTLGELDSASFTKGRALRAVLRQPMPAICLAGTILLLAIALAAPFLAPYDPNAADVLHRLKAPSALHWLGTDELGRDTLSRLLYGATTAMQTSLEAVSLAIFFGVPIGLLTGYFGGWSDRIVMRLTDIAQSIPSLIFAFAVIAILGRGTAQTAVAVAVVFGIILLRIARGLVLRERELLYVDGARVSGLSTPRILFREILPNVVGPLVVESAMMFGSAIMLVAMLSFLGLGLDSETPDWGTMLDEARKYQAVQPFMALPPGFAIMLTVLLFNFSGDALRDALMGRRALHRATRRSAKPSSKSVQKPASDGDTVLALDGLRVAYAAESGCPLEVVCDVSLALRRGETVGLVGESGSGKSTTGLAMMGLMPAAAHSSGHVWLGGCDLLSSPARDVAARRGSDIAMVFQDPIGAFSPVHTIGRQIIEPLETHKRLSRREATRRAVELLNLVGLPNAEKRIHDYPHQFSGGMAQRAMIAMALSCGPKVLIADEPTSALDVTVQAQVLKLIGRLSSEYDMAVLLITHDLGVVAESCDRVVVIYAGEIVEEGPVSSVLCKPRHPYTHALLTATPRNEAPSGRLPTIPGTVPAPWNWPQGCRFAPRCAFAIERCSAAKVPLTADVRCIRAGELDLTVQL
jgi:peptide/nickel transport system permease protein